MDSQVKNKVVFLVSGNGANLVLVDYFARKSNFATFTVVAVISDRPCIALERAEAMGIKNTLVNLSENFDELQKCLAVLKPDIVVTNLHRVLPAEILNQLPSKFINLHYSLLPAFGGSIGQKPVLAALEFGSKFLGATVHEVTENVDSGKPISQAVIDRKQNSPTELMDILFIAGVALLISALQGEKAKRKFSIINPRDKGRYGRLIFSDTPLSMPRGFWKELNRLKNENSLRATPTDPDLQNQFEAPRAERL